MCVLFVSAYEAASGTPVPSKREKSTARNETSTGNSTPLAGVALAPRLFKQATHTATNAHTHPASNTHRNEYADKIRSAIASMGKFAVIAMDAADQVFVQAVWCRPTGCAPDCVCVSVCVD